MYFHEERKRWGEKWGESLKGEWFVGNIGCWVVAGCGNEDSDASEIYEEEREGKDQIRPHPCGERNCEGGIF